MSLLDFALEVAGVPRATVEALDKDMPGFAGIAAAARRLEPILTEAKPLLDKLTPLLAQAWPIVVEAWPDIVTVTPTVEQMVELANSKEA